jgi:hypothetical protein
MLKHLPLQDGRRVLLLERDLTQPDRIVGELLQPGGYLMLKRLGLEDCTDSIGSQKVGAAWRTQQTTSAADVQHADRQQSSQCHRAACVWSSCTWQQHCWRWWIL